MVVGREVGNVVGTKVGLGKAVPKLIAIEDE
jgi:hypothetical protein